jgi:hypothetical protein
MTAAEFRLRAARCREQAPLNPAGIKERLLALAKSWDRLADQADRIEKATAAKSSKER